MGITIQGYGQSTLSCEPDQIVICLPRQVFGEAWSNLVAQLSKAIGHRKVINSPQRVMTEHDEGQDAPRWKQVCLDVLSWLVFLLKVPAGHELVRLWHTIDWQAINQICASVYKNAHGGRYAWAPAQMVALLVLMFLYGVAHETALLDRVKENIVWCWFCGFGLFGPVWPSHSALYDFRQRVGAACFEKVLTLVVTTCIEAGLVGNELVSFDLALVVASGHRWSPYERAVILSKALIRYLELSWADQRPEEPFPEALRTLAAEVALEVLPHKALDAVEPERVVESVERWTAKTDPQETPWQGQVEEAVEVVRATEDDELVLSPALSTSTALSVNSAAGEAEGPVRSEEGPAESQKDEGPSQDPTPDVARPKLIQVAKALLTRLPHTRGDPDARVGRTTSYTWFCGYLLGFVVDSVHHVITAVVWAAGNVKQSTLVRPAMEAHGQRVGDPKAAAMDSAFDDPQVQAYLDEKSIEGHITSRDHPSPADGGYGTDRLEWDDTLWILRCPNQTPLEPKGKPQQGRQTYVGTACQDCSQYEKCRPKGQGQPKRFTLDPATHRRWQENRQHCQTDEYKAAQTRRFVEEGRFGLAKMNHHGAKAPYRSDAMNRIAGLMIAIVMNYRILARHRQGTRVATP